MKRSLAVFALLVLPAALPAQERSRIADSTIDRALRLVADHDTAGGLRVLDSLARRGPTLLVRGESAYLLSRLTTSAALRERQLTAFVIDHPFSPRLPAVLYELGMLELAGNDRDRAVTHLSHFLTVAPSDTGRLTASLALGRLLLERGDLPRGCAVLMVGRSELPENAVELGNQFQFSIGRCQGVDTTSRVEVRPAVPDTAPAPRRTGAFTVQVAAYETKAAADRLATTLRGSGLEARVIGTAKPFRVRVGRYATRNEAEEASRRVDSLAKSRSLVVIVGPEER